MTDSLHGSPTALRMILGRQLQALREKAGLSYDCLLYTSPSPRD